MTPLILLAILGGGYVVARRRGASSLGGILKKHDGSSKDDPIVGVVQGTTSPEQIKGKWYVFADGRGPYHFPTDDELKNWMRSVADAAIHHHALPNPPAEWGPFTGWHASAGFAKVVTGAGKLVGAGVGFLAGGPAGAKAGEQIGTRLSQQTFL